jgi:hypothetical protein
MSWASNCILSRKLVTKVCHSACEHKYLRVPPIYTAGASTDSYYSIPNPIPKQPDLKRQASNTPTFILCKEPNCHHPALTAGSKLSKTNPSPQGLRSRDRVCQKHLEEARRVEAERVHEGKQKKEKKGIEEKNTKPKPQRKPKLESDLREILALATTQQSYGMQQQRFLPMQRPLYRAGGDQQSDHLAGGFRQHQQLPQQYDRQPLPAVARPQHPAYILIRPIRSSPRVPRKSRAHASQPHQPTRMPMLLQEPFPNGPPVASDHRSEEAKWERAWDRD